MSRRDAGRLICFVGSDYLVGQHVDALRSLANPTVLSRSRILQCNDVTMESSE